MNRRFTRFSIFAFLTIPVFCFSQGEFHNWYFGNHSGVTFNSGNPVAITDALFAGSVTVSVSDSAGNPLFYSYVAAVYNRNNVAMPNGWPLYAEGTDDNQPVLAVQNPGDDSTYYFFTGGQIGINPSQDIPVMYSIINMRLDGGLGDIEAGYKNIPLPYGEKGYSAVTGIRHHNNKDVWVVVRLCVIDSNFFATYLITKNGLNTIPILSNSKIYMKPNPLSTRAHEIKISPDGTKLVCLYDSDSTEVCGFNATTGEVNSLFAFKTVYNGDSIHPHSAEFSIDSKILYLSGTKIQASNLQNFIFQYDATQTNSAAFIASQLSIAYTYGRSGIQMGPDWKIYGTREGLDSLSVINNPSVSGAGCGFQNDVVGLQGNVSEGGLPQFVQRYKAYIHHIGNCQNNPIHIFGDIWPPPDSIHWDFGDPSSGPANYSNFASTTHTYLNTGTYIVELFVRHNDNRTDTSWQTITIGASPPVALGPDRTVCTGDSTTFDAGACSGCTYLWKDLGSSLTVGTNQTFRTSQPGDYSVTVTNSGGCSGSDTVQLSTTPVPSVTNNPLSKSICSGETTNIPLMSNVAGTMFHWTATLTSGNISGFSADSGLVINQTLVNSLSTDGIVTYHITPKVGSCAGNTVDLPVTVNPGDSVKISISASINNICAGTQVSFTTATIYGGPTPFYQWKVNGADVGTNSPTYAYTPVNGDLVSCIITSSLSVCITNNPATSNMIQMIVNPLNPVSISISPSANPVCAGIPVTFTAATMFGGPAPIYQWKVNGLNVGSNQSLYTYNPASGDLVSCILTSNAICPTGNPATSNQITMTVNPNLPVSITITASANPVCSGNAAIYTAAPVNGGSLPVYQWKVNGLNVGNNSSTYTYNPASGDQIKCILTSNIACPLGNPATSNTITMSVPSSPVVTFTRCNDSVTTTVAQPFRLKGGIPLGGTYSGAGVAGGIFNPAIAGVGTHQITYTYTNAALCSASAIGTIVTVVTVVTNCGQPFTDIRDGKSYSTIKIGNQCWMAEDLNYGYTIDESMNQRDNCIPEKYHNPASSIEHPASVYQWDEIINYDESISTQGLCPPGWHVPSEADWNTLFKNYTDDGFAASPLKYSGFSGFNALLNGALHLNKNWDFQGLATLFWSSTPHGTEKAWSHGMNDPDPSVSAYPAFKSNAFSVRCLKD